MSTAFRPITSPPPTFREARDLLLELHDNYCDAKTAFVWPRPERFNWALDWFDAELAAGEAGARPALKVLGKTVETKSFAELSEASSRLASGLRALGAKRGDRLLMMLGTTPELWLIFDSARTQVFDRACRSALRRGRGTTKQKTCVDQASAI